MNARELFKETASRLRDNIPAALHADLKTLERSYHDLHQINGALKRNLEEIEARVRAFQSQALQAKSAADQQMQHVASLSQKLVGKEQQAKRLQSALTQAEALLIGQQKQGYNAQMIADFLDHVEADLRVTESETAHSHATDEQRHNLMRCAQKYGYCGCFTPNIQIIAEDPQSPATILKAEELRQHRAAVYKAELAHLLAVRERLSIAVEACRRHHHVLVRRIAIRADGTVSDTRDVWLESEQFRRLVHSAKRQVELRQSESQQQEVDEDPLQDSSDFYVGNLPESPTATPLANRDIDGATEQDDAAAFVRWLAKFEPRR